ncbi:MAG: ferredoxin family protein [Verrucomicrobiales bacterium]|nr:ferredoxin family protein [Verrucomicrobiales bacterium]
MINDAAPIHISLYEGNEAAALPPAHRFSIISTLLDRGYSVALTDRNEVESPTRDCLRLILGEFSKTVNPPTTETSSVQALDIAGLDSAAILAQVEQRRAAFERPMNQPPASLETASANTERTWKPWFPVIDFDRCTNCMQCLSFCLFDVYSVDDEQQIEVRNQDNCKTNCPACSRVCPEVAIMFPKYKAGPINGDEVSENDLNREKMKVDISSLLGGDIYSSLRNRSEAAKSRFSKERSPDKALAERTRCLNKLQSDGLIPAEVLADIDLASLPSPEEIKRKAEEAAALAKKANS